MALLALRAAAPRRRGARDRRAVDRRRRRRLSGRGAGCAARLRQRCAVPAVAAGAAGRTRCVVASPATCGGGRCATATRPAGRRSCSPTRSACRSAARSYLGAGQRRRDPQLLGAGAGRQDGHGAGPRRSSCGCRPSAPGVYRGQCAEFCGEQHARMALHVVAPTPAELRRLAARRRRAPARRAASAPQRARPRTRSSAQRCAACHAVRGVADGGAARPRPHPRRQPRCTSAPARCRNDRGGAARAGSPTCSTLKPGARMPSYDAHRRGDAAARWPPTWSSLK